jgi:uncharacterized protein
MHTAFLTATWQHLLFMNYEVEQSLLAAHVPSGTELDLLDGRALVSIVAFRFLDTKICGVPVPWHRDFDEVNLRAYVRRKEHGKWIRGVVFVRELVPKPAIAWTARLLYNEPYRAVPMRHAIAWNETGGSVRYQWKQAGAWHSVSASASGESQVIAEDSDTAFITEHYVGYTPQRDGGTVQYDVSHAKWRVWTLQSVDLQCDVATVYGPAWYEALTATPRSSFVCDGAPVAISFPRRLPR